MDTDRRTSAPLVLLAGLGGVAAWLLLRTRRTPATSTSAERPTTPVGRVGEPGPEWSVVQTVAIARPAGEVAQHLHDHGGLPGLTGGLEGPVLDRIEWNVPGSGHFEAEVHSLPGANHTEVTLRISPETGSARSAAEHAAASLPLVGGGSLRSQASRSLAHLQRLLESTQPGSPERAAAAAEVAQGR
ncbi:hypothetical protein SAMN06264364_13419 [Quadrisphaera granulorum]|uniref:Polyketide cyclase/dehydrase/lipid transport protein n=1 Tax=Quadrisphaera granulorum TaxID=317664 RepID=A0A315ZQP0_9ACTN|nr:hypothetical protein [Quadrisphaera granulorum]PWJ47846.1 hypothetical protein BXY45_13419 [Quadrisphaera granulorum]SZE98613.1 hypothetical protein SAMN06264364_13419 [Quadrisphaera granulorum]